MGSAPSPEDVIKWGDLNAVAAVARAFVFGVDHAVLALEFDKVEIAEYLLSKLRLNSFALSGTTAYELLDLAVIKGSVVAYRLVQRSSGVPYTAAYGHHAGLRNRGELVTAIEQHLTLRLTRQHFDSGRIKTAGENENARSEILRGAIEGGHVGLVARCIGRGYRLDGEHLNTAIRSRNRKLIDYLFDAGCPSKWDSALTAIWAGDLETLKRLYQVGAVFQPWLADHSKSRDVTDWLGSMPD